MKIRNYLLIIYYFFGSYAFGEKTFSFYIQTEKQPKLYDDYYFHPATNSQILIDSTIIDIFEWKIAATNKNLVQIKLENEQWETLNGKQSTTKIQQRFFISPPIKIRGCPIVKSQFIPWRIDANGQLEYLKEGLITISIKEDIELQNISFIPPNIINLQHIKSTTQNFNTSEYIIFSPPELLSIANELAYLHQEEIPEEFRLLTEVISTESITDGEEALSPELIRNFILDRIDENLRYILFFGDETSIPPYYYNDTPTDDYFTSSTNDQNNPQIPTGRIPVSNIIAAESIINQIRNYILEPIGGNWKSKILLLADDQNHPDNEEYSHVINSNLLYEKLNDKLNFINLYGTEYIPQPSGGWFEHPELTSDLLSNINSGVGLINYIGHGSPTALSHENILNMSRDINLIQSEKQAIWIVGTCSFGYYDDNESMAEALLHKNNGSIGLITTTRKVFATTNIQYLNRVFDNILAFVKNDISNLPINIDNYINYRLGDLAYYSKEGNSDYLFQVFGDPALPLPFPQEETIINTDLSSQEYQVATQAEIILQELVGSNYFTTVRGSERYNNIGYYLPGEIIFQGNIQSPISFYIPLDIFQSDSDSAKVIVYSDNNMINGSIDNFFPIPILNNENISSDIYGPKIYLWQNSNLINTISMMTPPYNFTIGITDTSGINLTGSMGHNLRYQINDQEVILNQEFTYITTDSGSVDFTLPNNIKSPINLYIEAWDNVNNMTNINYTLINGNETEFSIEKIYNYPNPFTIDTYFTFFANDEADIIITVYSINGIKVIQKKMSVSGGDLSSIYWDGKDNYYNTIANGTYFYHLLAKNEAGMEFEYISKLSKIK